MQWIPIDRQNRLLQFRPIWRYLIGPQMLTENKKTDMQYIPVFLDSKLANPSLGLSNSRWTWGFYAQASQQLPWMLRIGVAITAGLRYDIPGRFMRDPKVRLRLLAGFMRQF